MKSPLYTRRSEGKKGFGLVAQVNISAEQFIVEYCGVVIGEVACKEILRKAVTKHRDHARSYVMSLNFRTRDMGGLYVDAMDTKHPCKYINHSCDPNCYAERWLVMGIPRVAVFAKRAIEMGEMLSMDYGWEESSDWPSQPCFCGSSVCRGFLQRKM